MVTDSTELRKWKFNWKQWGGGNKHQFNLGKFTTGITSTSKGKGAGQTKNGGTS